MRVDRDAIGQLAESCQRITLEPPQETDKVVLHRGNFYSGIGVPSDRGGRRRGAQGGREGLVQVRDDGYPFQNNAST